MPDGDRSREILALVMEKDTQALGALALELNTLVQSDRLRRERQATKKRRQRGTDEGHEATVGDREGPEGTSLPTPIPPKTQPSVSQSPPAAREAAELDRLTGRLPEGPCRVALQQLLEKAPNPMGWILEMHAMLDGMGGHVHVTPAQLAEALIDFMANGATEQPNLRHFKTYAQRAKRAIGEGGGGPPPGRRPGPRNGPPQQFDYKPSEEVKWQSPPK